MLPAKPILTLSAAACMAALAFAPAATAGGTIPLNPTVDLEAPNYVLTRGGAVVGRLLGYAETSRGTRMARIEVDFGVPPGLSPHTPRVVMIPARHVSPIGNQKLLNMSYAEFATWLANLKTV